MKFVVRFSKNIELHYDLIDHEIVSTWKRLISFHTISDCCPNNHYLGYASHSEIQEKIKRLYELCDLINARVPDRAIKHDITIDNWQHPLSVMHVHFPDLKNDRNYIDIWDYLTEYNDAIHWLETSLPRVGNSSFFRVTLDFNKANTRFLSIPESAYELFTPDLIFGELLLHYTHVGKNAFELFFGKDFECPSDQFVPQRTFSASVRMYFTDNIVVPNAAWEKFYEDRGGKDFWKYDITDPKIGFGFMKIGQLSNILVDGNEISMPSSEEEVNAFRNELAQTTVIDWTVE